MAWKFIWSPCLVPPPARAAMCSLHAGKISSPELRAANMIVHLFTQASFALFVTGVNAFVAGVSAFATRVSAFATGVSAFATGVSAIFLLGLLRFARNDTDV